MLHKNFMRSVCITDLFIGWGVFLFYFGFLQFRAFLIEQLNTIRSLGFFKEMIIANLALCMLLAIYHLISNMRMWKIS